MEKKIGCYICSGCGIGDKLDIPALEATASKEHKINVVKNHAFLCGEEGVAMIRQDMETEGVNALIIAACSPRVHVDTFRFNTAIMDRVNLREQVIWLVDDSDEETGEEDMQMMADDQLGMGCIKVKKMNAPEPFQDPGLSKRILVVGGGVTGLTAAKNIAEAGYDALLVEKGETLGGMVAKMHKVSPSTAPYKEPEASGIEDLIAAVEGNDKITVLKNTSIKQTEGGPGLFDVTIANGSGDATERVGSIVMATGYNLYDPSKLEGNWGFGASPDVITAMDFEEMAKAGSIVRKSDGQPAKKVAFALCAGSRNKNHLEYCSSACCTYAIKQSMYVQELYGDEAEARIIYQEIRTPGQMEDFYRAGQDAGTVFVKGDLKEVKPGAGGGVSINLHDHLLRGDETMDADLLVLATGMQANTDVRPSDTHGVTGSQIDAAGNILEEAETTEAFKAAQKAQEEWGSILNLDYRQGKGLPELKNGFPDSHYICFPYESRRTGIYAAGPVRRPMGVNQSRSDAMGAALKAIQAVESVSRGAAVHPRAGDLSYPSFDINGCTQCKRCTEECPFGAINEDEKGNPQFKPTRCRRCGTCMGACPQKIISFANYSIDMMGSMLKGCEIPEEDEEKPRILIFACENDAYPALDQVGFGKNKISPYVRIIPLRCMGSMNLVWIADAMSTGYDGVMLMGCKHGEDYQCHFMRGSWLATNRLSKVSETLSRLQLEPERVRMVEVNIMDADTIPKLIEEFVEDLDEYGPNPFKEF